MKQEFDFEKVGKRIPYSVPKKFFETNAQRMIEEANRQSKSQRIVRKSLLISLTTAASIALIVSIYLFVNKTNNSQSSIASNKTNMINSSANELKVETLIDSVVAPRSSEKASPVQIQKAAHSTLDKVKSVDELVASISDEELEQMVMQIDNDPFLELHSY